MSSRWLRPVLIGAVLAAQGAVILVAWVVGFRDVVDDVERDAATRERVAAEGTAAGIAVAISKAGVESLEPGTDGWQRAQSIIGALHLPNGAIASIVSTDGRVLCHPELSETAPFIRRLAPRPSRFTATAPLPRHDATVTISEPLTTQAGIQEAAQSAITVRTVAAGVMILMLTGMAAAGLVSLHGRRLARINLSLRHETVEQSDEIVRTREAMILGLAKLADYRDSDTGHHLDRICTFAVLLAEAASADFPEIDAEFLAHLRLAASLHDIGKVGIPDSVLLKPGMLTPREREVVERHPVIGAATLDAIRQRAGGGDRLLGMSIEIALRHHEKWDGTGYPGGMSGEDIPLSARLVALADVYDALTSDRVYKVALGHTRACEIIREGRGAHFDPRLVDAFQRVADRFSQERSSLGTSGRRAAA